MSLLTQRSPLLAMRHRITHLPPIGLPSLNFKSQNSKTQRSVRETALKENSPGAIPVPGTLECLIGGKHVTQNSFDKNTNKNTIGLSFHHTQADTLHETIDKDQNVVTYKNNFAISSMQPLIDDKIRLTRRSLFEIRNDVFKVIYGARRLVHLADETTERGLANIAAHQLHSSYIHQALRGGNFIRQYPILLEIILGLNPELFVKAFEIPALDKFRIREVVNLRLTQTSPVAGEFLRAYQDWAILLDQAAATDEKVVQATCISGVEAKVQTMLKLSEQDPLDDRTWLENGYDTQLREDIEKVTEALGSRSHAVRTGIKLELQHLLSKANN